jgi:hypothetical protein
VRTQWLRESRVATHGPATAIASVERRVLKGAFLCRWWREVARATGLWNGDGFWSGGSIFPAEALLQRTLAALIDALDARGTTYSAGGRNNAAVMAGLEEH